MFYMEIVLDDLENWFTDGHILQESFFKKAFPYVFGHDFQDKICIILNIH